MWKKETKGGALSNSQQFEKDVHAISKGVFKMSFKEAYVTHGKGIVVELDTLIIHNGGLIIIEAKNVSGMILGKVNAETWVSMKHGGVAYRFHNPLRQTTNSRDRLCRRFDISPQYVKTIIVFASNANISNVLFNSSNNIVCRIDDLQNILLDIKSAPIQGLGLNPFVAGNIAKEVRSNTPSKMRELHRTVFETKKKRVSSGLSPITNKTVLARTKHRR